MDGDMNYYQTSYHQGGGPSAAMKHPPAAPTDAYPRARTIPGGPIPSGAPLSHHQSYSSDTMSYGSRAPATGPQPLRKTMDSVGTSVPSGLPPSMLRDYSYERNNPYDDKKMHTASRLMPTESAVSQQQHSSITGYPNRAAYLHEEAASHHPKYEMHGSGSTVGRVHGGYPNEDISVSKMSSYSAGGAPGMLHSSRDLASINAYDRDYAREHEPQTRSTVPAVSSLEKYFSSEEIKQFSDYNRHLAMSTPVQQKKFYESLTTAEYNRFRDFVDFDRNNKPSANFKAALPPPIPSAAPLPVPTPYDNHSTAYPSSYSFASSFYEEDKMSSGSGGHRPPIHHLKSKYSNSSGSPPPQPPPMPPFMKGMSSYQAFPESSYERSLSTRDLSTGMSRYADMSMRMGRADLRETLPPERSLGHERSARPGYHLSRSRSRSITPENRSRSSRYHRHGSPSRREEYPKHSKGYLLRESRTDSHSHSRSRRSHSRSPGARDRKRSRKSLSKEGKESVDGREHKQSSAVQNSTRKLAPKEEHYYLLDSLTKVRKIHKVKLEELEEIKKKDDGKCDSYIYKKVASSVKDIEERIATVERQLEANRIVLGDSFPEVEKAYEEKEKEKKTSLKALRGMETKSKPVSDTKVTNDEPTEKKKNELSKDASSSSIVSSASTIEATAETVAKLPKIPKLSAKKSADVDDSDDETKTAKKPTDDDASNESATAKKSSNKEEIKNGSVKSSNVEPSSSNKSESKEPSKPTSARYSGPITEDEIEQILPFYQYCSLCKNFFESTDEFITHLHREAHLNGLRTSDFLIIKRAEEKLDTQMLSAEQASVAAVNGSDKAPVVATNALETLGSEFLYPCKAFYCDLCAKFLYTTQQTELHLSSEKHVTLYKKYLQKNKEYAPKMINQRKSAFKYSYLLRTLIRMKDKGEDIVTRVSQEMVRRAKKEREKNEREKEKEKSSESGKGQITDKNELKSKVELINSCVVDKESSVAESSNAETDTKKLSVKKENDDDEDTVQTASKDVAEKTENSVDLTKVKKEEVEVSVKPEENENGSSSGQNEEENEDNDENGENEEDEEESPETVGEGDNDENGNADDLENVNLEEEDYEEIMDLNETNEGIFEMNIEDMNIFGDEVDKFLSEQQAANGNIAQQVNDIIMQEEEEDTEEEEENVAGQNEEEDGSFDVIDEA